MDQGQMGQTGQTGAKCPCPHHKMVPLFIVLLGLTFLLQALNVLTAAAVAITWPILLILIGAQKMMESKCKCCGRMM